jgi:hypothetical protein
MELQQQTDHAHGSAHFTPLGHWIYIFFIF